MMVLIIIHAIFCVGLIFIVLIQRGRGAGLVESFAGVESMFGTKTNVFLTRATTFLAVGFFITCLALAILSIRQSKSLMTNVKPAATAEKPATEAAATATAPAPATQPAQDAPKAQ